MAHFSWFALKWRLLYEEAFFLEAIRFGMTDGGMCCGPVAGDMIAELQLRTEGGERLFFGLTEVGGIPCFHQAVESQFNFLMYSDDAKIVDMECFEQAYSVFPGMLYEDIFCVRDAEWFDAQRCLIYLVRCDDAVTRDSFIACACGQWLDEILIPPSDIEKDFYRQHLT